MDDDISRHTASGSGGLGRERHAGRIHRPGKDETLGLRVAPRERLVGSKHAPRGLYAEARMRGQVVVWAVEPCHDLAHWMIEAFAATAQIMGMDEVTVLYRSRKIRDGIIDGIDLA